MTILSLVTLFLLRPPPCASLQVERRPFPILRHTLAPPHLTHFSSYTRRLFIVCTLVLIRQGGEREKIPYDLFFYVQSISRRLFQSTFEFHRFKLPLLTPPSSCLFHSPCLVTAREDLVLYYSLPNPCSFLSCRFCFVSLPCVPSHSNCQCYYLLRPCSIYYALSIDSS